MRRARERRAAACVLAALAFAPVCARAGDGFPLRGVGRPAFVLDAVTIPVGPDSVDLEITWQIPLRELAFRPEDEVYRARYEVAVILSRDGRQVAGDLWTRRVRTRSLSETREAGRTSGGRRTIRLPTGRFELRATVTDRTAGSSSVGRARLEARGEESGIGLSDLRLVRYTEDGAQHNPGHDVTLGEIGYSVRASVRGLAGAKGSVELRWRITDPGGRKVVEGDSTLHVSAAGVVDIPIPSDALFPGRHDVEVRLSREDRSDRRTLELNARLSAKWFEVNRESATEILSLLADDAENGALRSASDAEWPAVLETFWARRDAASGGPGEARREVQARVEAVCTLFVEPFRSPGWKTDRGRVWIRFGRPDRRTESAGDFDHPATEVWEYDAPRRVLVFVDRGSGEFWFTG